MSGARKQYPGGIVRERRARENRALHATKGYGGEFYFRANGKWAKFAKCHDRKGWYAALGWKGEVKAVEIRYGQYTLVRIIAEHWIVD